MFVVEKSVAIDAPVGHVWELLSKLDGVETWLDDVIEAHYHTKNTSGVGAGRTCDIKGFGTVVETAVEWKENESFTLDIQGMPAIIGDAKGTWTLAPSGDSQTNATMRIRVETRFWPLGAIMEKLMLRRNFMKNVEGGTAAFKQYVETTSTASDHDPAATDITM
jgi:uncharacterized protein YndB with AHSA1/START domain